MTDDDKRAARRVPVVLRIKLRYKKVDTFISKFATNISSTGMFISSRKPKAVGTELKFELRLSDDSPVVSGTGVVKWVREYDADRPRQPHGMGIQFTEVSDESRALIDRIVEHKRDKGVEDDGEIPRKDNRKRTRRKRKRPITYTPPDAGARPSAEAEAEQPAEDVAREPAADGAPEPAADAVPEQAAAPVGEPANPPEPLEPRKRLHVASVEDVIARATANAGSSNGEDWSESKLRELIDQDVPSMDRALALARRLAGNVGEEELAELTRVSATAVADSVDNASDALASLLGGTAVASRRRRRAKRPDPAPVPAQPEAVVEPEMATLRDPEPEMATLRDPEPEPVAEGTAQQSSEDQPSEPDPEPAQSPQEAQDVEVNVYEQAPSEFPEGTLDVPVIDEAHVAAPQTDDEHLDFGEEEDSFSRHEGQTVVAAADYVETVAAQAQAAIDSAMAAADSLDEAIPDLADPHTMPTAAEIDMDTEEPEFPDQPTSTDGVPPAEFPDQHTATDGAPLYLEPDPGASDDAIPIDIDDVVEELDAAHAPLPSAPDIEAEPEQLPRAPSIDAALDALESDNTLDDEIPIDLDDSDFAGGNN